MNPESFDLVAFTTAAASRPFYRRDALNAVSYPERWLLTLTYRKKWVEPSVWQDACSIKIGAFGAKLGNYLYLRRVLVVLGIDPNETEDKFGKFIPLRFGVIRHAGIVGDKGGDNSILVVRLCLEGRPSKSLAETFPGPFDASFTLPRPKTDSYYVVPVKAPAAVVTEVLRGEYDWAGHIDFLRDSASVLRNCRYIRLRGIRSLDVSGEHAAAAEIESGESSRLTTVTLWAGKSYEWSFQVHQSVVSSWTKVPLEVEVAGAHVEVTIPVATQNGAAVDVSYILAAQRKYATETVTVITKTRTACGCVTPAGDGPEFQFLVRIRPPRLFWLWTIAPAAVGAVLLNFTKEVLTSLDFAGSDIELLGSRLLGGVLLTLAGFYALRRLPLNKF